MKKLYTINGKYPDVDFAFTVAPEDFDALPVAHTHPLGTMINAEKNSKAYIGHGHAEYAHTAGTAEAQNSGQLALESGTGIALSVSDETVTIANATQNASGGAVKNLANCSAAAKPARFQIVTGARENITTKKPSVMLLGEV